MLTRTLYEEIVTFAWIGIDPPEHASAWLRWDRSWRIKADKDLQNVGAEPLLEPEVRKAFEKERDSGRLMPDVARRAEEADRYWSQQIDAISDDPADPRTFRGMYRYLYRSESWYAHAAVASIDRLVVDSDEPGYLRVLADETDPGETNPFTRAPLLYALGLLAAESALGWTGIGGAIDTIVAALK